MRVITVANMKGGSGKTTTVAYLAHAFQAAGRPVLCVDADKAESLLRWREFGGWSIPVVGMRQRVHVDLPNVAGRYDLVLVDTPPVDEERGAVVSAIRAATDVVVPVGPSTMELDRLSPVFDAIEEAEDLMREPPTVRVLLTRALARAASTAVAREVIPEQFKTELFRTSIPLLERYKQAFGTTPKLAPGDPYALVAEELLGHHLTTGDDQ